MARDETLEDELARTRRERDQAQRRTEARRDDLADERGEFRDANKAARRNQNRIEDLRDRLGDARKDGREKQVERLQARLEGARDTRKDLRRTRRQEKADLAPARRALTSAQNALSQARSNYQSVVQSRQDAQNYLQELRASNPWLDAIGISPTWLQNVIADSATAAAIVAKIRQTPQYRKRFVGLHRPDGTMRMNEAQYIQTENAYRTLLRQNGIKGYDSPEQLVGFFQADLDPNELSDRLEVWRGIKTGGQAIKDAFYVYAGMNVGDDDLLASVVDPAAAQNLQNEFNQRVAQGSFNYQQWIARATNAGLGRVAARLRQLQRQGAVTATAVQSIMSVNPEFAQRVMSAIYQGAGDDTSSLSLAQALEAFEFAAIGAAANSSGLELPSLERLRQIRAHGIERAQAIEAYTQFGKNASLFNAAVQRARGRAFGQQQFESATFLGNAGLQRELEAGMQAERAAGVSQGTFRFNEDSTGRIVQRGFTRPA